MKYELIKLEPTTLQVSESLPATKDVADYEALEWTKPEPVYKTDLYQIRALKDFGNVKKGQLGGFVTGEYNLDQDGDCWIGLNAIVKDDAHIMHNAQVMNYATVMGNALIQGNAIIKDRAIIDGNIGALQDVVIGGDSVLRGNLLISNREDNKGEGIITSRIISNMSSDEIKEFEAINN